jgi:cysteine desulfurase
MTAARRRIYLDYNATAPLRPEARAAALAAMDVGANASSIHAGGRHARSIISCARDDVAGLVGADSGQIVFTSGGTEANALALLGGAEAGLFRRLIVFALEHDSVRATARLAAERYGSAFQEIGATADGIVDLPALETALRVGDGKALVSVMAANNETGAVQPIDRVRALCTNAGALLHVDAVQIAGRLPFDARGYDFVTLSAHKLGGLHGAGALILGRGIEIDALWRGGAQEVGLRPGTESVTAIAAFGAAARVAASDLTSAHQQARLRDAMEARLSAAMPALKVFGGEAPRLPQTSCLGVPGLAAETQVIALDLAGVGVSAGAACSSGKVRASHVLTAMGVSAEAARCAIRVSFGWATRADELERFTEIWLRQLERSLIARRASVAVGA